MHDPMLAPATVWEMLQGGHAQLIDLRAGPGEAVLPRIPGARAIALSELPSELGTLDRERPVIFISETGRQAAGAMKALRAAGMAAWSVEGGFRAWQRAGLPTAETRSTPADGERRVSP